MERAACQLAWLRPWPQELLSKVVVVSSNLAALEEGQLCPVRDPKGVADTTKLKLSPLLNNIQLPLKEALDSSWLILPLLFLLGWAQ